LTVTDKQTIRKNLNINHKNAHINTIQMKENKQLNIQQKQNYPGSVTFYDSRPGMRRAYSTTAPSTTWDEKNMLKNNFHGINNIMTMTISLITNKCMQINLKYDQSLH